MLTLAVCPQMIHQQPNPGVHYEYVIMGNNAISPQVPPHRRPGKAPCFATKRSGHFVLKFSLSSCAPTFRVLNNAEKPVDTHFMLVDLVSEHALPFESR